MPLVIQYPQINGHRFSFDSLEIRVNGIWFVGIKSLNYKPTLKAGLVRGTNPRPIGRTAGEAEFTWDMEILRLEFELLKTSLGCPPLGFGETSFPIVATFQELGSPVITDVVQDCRIEEADLSNASGSDASTVKLSGTAMGIDLGLFGAGITTPRAAGL